jgi:hypothetical protein
MGQMLLLFHAETTKADPLLIQEKIGFQSHVLLPPTLAIGCDASDDDKV